MTPWCAASATWNPHVDVKGLEDAAGTGLWQCRRGRSRGCRHEGMKWETEGMESLGNSTVPGAETKPQDTLQIRKTPWHGVTEQPPAVPLPGPNVTPEPNEKKSRFRLF